jgi:hypothetical protein
VKAPVLVYVALAAMFTAAMIDYSRNYGRMLVGPLYDDVVYLNEGLLYAQLAQTQGLPALLQYAIQRPPHSPFATGTALLSFILFGPVEWAPYAFMGLGVLAVVLAADRLLVGLPCHARVAGALFVLSFPIVGTLPYHFRPDAAAGLVTGFGSVMMLRYSPFWAPRAHQYWTGLCFALALIIKTPAVPFTLCMLLGSWVLSTLCGRRSDLVGPARRTPAQPQKDRQGYFAAIWPYSVPVLLVAGPYYWLAGRQVYHYIYDNVFGQNRDIWQLRLDWMSLARFIWDGQGGQLMLRGHGYLVVGLACLAGLAYLVARRGRAFGPDGVRVALGVIGVLFLAWLFPTLSRYGNPFTGSAFAAILLFVGVLLLRSLFVLDLRGNPVGRAGVGTALGWATVLLALLAFRWPAQIGTKTSDWVVTGNRVERAVYRAIADHAAGNGATAFMTSAANLNADLLQFRARVDHLPLTLVGAPLSSDLEDFRTRIAASDYVVSGDQGAFQENQRLPMYQLQNTLVSELKADPGFHLLATIPAHQGLNIYVFGRKQAFGGWTTAQSLGPLEGPFPPAGNKMVRWGLGPTTLLTVTSATTRPGIVEFTAVTMREGQAVEVVVNGTGVARVALTQREAFKTVQVPIRWRVGENRLELRYATWEPQPADSAKAVLFKVLRVE